MGTGGLNAAFNSASGSISSLGSGIWATPGLLYPESMSLTFAGLVGTATLPSPWGVVNSSGVVVRAHGTQTGQDTNSYSVNLTSLVPVSGVVTAILAATIATIQQDPFPLTGPPLGHPSFNPNFIPTTAYATTTYTVALAAATGVVDNITTFELARITLSPGQVSVASYSTLGWKRAGTYTPVPASVLPSGGVLGLNQAVSMILPGANGLTSTLPAAASGGGLQYRLSNPSSTSSWTIAASVGNSLAGAGLAPASSIVLPPYASMTVWGNALNNVWEVTGVNPLMMASLPNNFTAPQTITDQSTAALSILGTGGNGANLKLTGNGTATPSKYIRVLNGVFEIINSAYSASIFDLTDAGSLSIPGSFGAGSLSITAAATIGNGLTVTAGGIYSENTDPGGMQFRTSFGATGPGAGFRNDGSSFYLLFSATPAGGFNGLRPLTVNLTTGVMALDGTGAGVFFGGLVSMPNINASIGQIGSVLFPGGGIINTNGAITSASQVFGGTVAANTTVTAGTRLRAALGAFGSGDPNAATILNDFTRQVSSGFQWDRLPDGTIIQSYGGQSVTGTDFVVFPIAFPTICTRIVIIEAAPAGWAASSIATMFGAQQLSASSFALYVQKMTNGTPVWSPAAGISYQYIAIGY